MSLSLSTLEENVRALTAARYLSIVGFTISTYDALLMFRKEFEQVWSSKHHKNKFFRNVLIFNRYGMLFTLILYLSTVSIPVGDLSRQWCIGTGSVVILMHVLLGICGDGLVIYVVCWTWDWKKDVCWMLCAGFTIISLTAVTFIAVAIGQFYGPDVTYFLDLGFLRTCYVSKIPPFYTRSFIASAAMDCYVLLFLSMNALSRPRSVSDGVLKIMFRDGLQFILVTFTMKLTNIIVTSTSPVAIALFYPTFGLAINSTATSRLYLRMCMASTAQGGDLRDGHDPIVLGIIDKEIPLALIPSSKSTN